ncbi:Edem3 protein [Loa loa]|uniref:alpha-1,2-Mannosidase n=1 Tax=Loa loa TaxID=7209 RepID=A0A1S0ULA1_LOALO|nr:Edem3 protein [Loa loa]EJD75564.1 Edem3 protein [Loa loa]
MLNGMWRWRSSVDQFMCSVCVLHLYIGLVSCDRAYDNEKIDTVVLRLQAKEMFMHGYNSYMKYAYPHDELMPLSCKGRQRGVTPPRGDVDDALGNFSLTLVDSLDALVVLGELGEFEESVRRIVKNVRFDSNLVVSVFETNIRMVGGLISGHVMAKLVQSRDENRLGWYKDELLQMAAELADRLLPAFNTTSGVPYSRINLKYGMLDFLRQQHDTCTACGGTMILEFAALSRLTGKPVYEEKARKAMDFLWAQRHRGSDLMGTVLNVHSGDWIRRDAGIGAGIDSYYEYCLKAYILLGDEGYLYRFNKHYDAIMRYVNKGPLFIDVHMHKPTVAARTYMDSLLAFWPGIQVLKGDLKAAIEFHETLYQVIKRHKFLPEAFTHDLQVHWAQHPIRPEFIESTYLLYRATKDEHYLHVAKNILDSMNKFLRVECGFAAFKDIRSMNHEDRMDSFVLSETLKYLYMIFTNPSDLPIDLDNYVLTTEAHFIPLSIGDTDNSEKLTRRLFIDPDEIIDDENAIMAKKFRSACPAGIINENYDNLPAYAEELRHTVQNVVSELTKNSESANSCPKIPKRLSAWSFSATNVEHMKQLKQMGIQMQFQVDGHVHLTHSPDMAVSPEWAVLGSEFIQEMIVIASSEKHGLDFNDDRVVQVVSQPIFGKLHWRAASAQFGQDLNHRAVIAEVQIAVPFRACRPLTNAPRMKGRIAIVQRQDCMFQEKARYVQKSGAVGIIIIDNTIGTSIDVLPPFAMSGDQTIKDDIVIPAVFLYNKEGLAFMEHIVHYPNALVRLSDRLSNPSYLFEDFACHGKNKYSLNKLDFLEDIDFSEDVIVIDSSLPAVLLNFRFASVSAGSSIEDKQKVIEENIEEMQKLYNLETESDTVIFYNVVRQIGYWQLGLNMQPTEAQLRKFFC